MRFSELAVKRTSVRGFADRPVPEEALNEVLETARMAPSAANVQPWRFIVVRDPARREALKEAYAKPWFAAAPVILVVCVDMEKAWKRMDGRSYAYVDGAIAMDHITLAAADLGLGTCWVGAFDPEAARRVLNLPGGVEVVGMTPLGYPTDAGRPKKRKAMDEVRFDEVWGGAARNVAD